MRVRCKASLVDAAEVVKQAALKRRGVAGPPQADLVAAIAVVGGDSHQGQVRHFPVKLKEENAPATFSLSGGIRLPR